MIKRPHVRKELERLHDQYLLAPAEKACNYMVFVWHIIFIAF